MMQGTAMSESSTLHCQSARITSESVVQASVLLDGAVVGGGDSGVSSPPTIWRE